MNNQTIPADELRALLDGEGSAADKIQAIYDDLLPPAPLPDPLFLAKATHPNFGEGIVVSARTGKDGYVRFISPDERYGDGTSYVWVPLSDLTFHTLTKPLALADTEWDDNVHPYMEAVTVSGRRHILLAPMGDTEVSENTILVAEHDGGMPVLVPAEHLSPTGRYARLAMPEDHPEFLQTEEDYRSAPEGTIVASNDEKPAVLIDELWRSTNSWEVDHDDMAGIRRRVLRWGRGA